MAKNEELRRVNTVTASETITAEEPSGVKFEEQPRQQPQGSAHGHSTGPLPGG